VQRKFSITPEEWEKRTGKKISDDVYRRAFTKEEEAAIRAEYDKYRKYKEKTDIESDWGEDAREDELLDHTFVPIDMIGAARAVLRQDR
jgi:hypothetical protein